MKNLTPFIQRLSEAYEKQRYTYFVTDGEGNCMADGMTEEDARIHAFKNEGWSIGRQEIEKLSDGEVLDLVYDRVNKILEEVDEYMTNPEQRYSTDEYNTMFGRMEACNEVMKVLKNNEDYEYVDHAINKYDKENE